MVLNPSGAPSFELDRAPRAGAFHYHTTMNTNESDRNGGDRRISGLDLKRIRESCGYSAREFANLLNSTGARITTARSVYRLEERSTIPSRYVDALAKLVGAKNFDTSLQAIFRKRRRPGDEGKRYAGNRMKRSRRGKGDEHGHGKHKARSPER